MIRVAQTGDAAAICALFEQVDAIHATARPDMFRAPERLFRTAEAVHLLLASATDTLFVAADGDRLLGVAWVIARTAPDLPIFVPRRFAVVETLVVDAEARRQGVGRALMRHIERWATELEFKEVQLSVHEFNASARAFYADLGYEVVEWRLRRVLNDR